jgi:hypothetical protein
VPALAGILYGCRFFYKRRKESQMSFQLLPDLTPTVMLVGAVLAVVVAVAALAALVVVLGAHRRLRVARREPVLHYYGRLALGHSLGH